MSMVLWITLVVASFQPDVWPYLVRQVVGQVALWQRTLPVSEYHPPQAHLQSQLALVKAVKQYAEDSLGFTQTNNFQTIDTVRGPVQWVVTASLPDQLQPVMWWYRVIGKAGYRGYFEAYRAIQMAQKLRSQGLDVQVSTVTAWSTLGYFSDPILRNMLDQSSAELADVIFHELFHATCFMAGSTSQNENLASFIAEKATCQFFKKDTLLLKTYLNNLKQEETLRRLVSHISKQFKQLYDTVSKTNCKMQKQRLLSETGRWIRQNNGLSEQKKERLVYTLFSAQNAWLTSYAQYNNLHDSLDFAFNNIYKGNLKKMVRDLSQSKHNY